MTNRDSIDAYGSEPAANLASAIYEHFAAGQRPIDSARFKKAAATLKAASSACSEEEKNRILKMVGPYTMATLP